MNIKTTFLLNRPGLFEVDVTYKPNTDPSTPDTAPWGGRGLHFPRCFPFKLAAAPLPGRTLLPAASQGTGTKTISSARSGDRAAASQTPALPWPGQAPRVWAGGVTAQRAHPGRRRGGAVKSAISVKGSESRGACRRKPTPGLLPRGGGDVSCHYASGSAAALLSQFCPNFVFFFNCDDWEVSPTHGLRGDRMLLRLRSAAGACYRCGLSGWTGKGATGQSKREART